VADDDKGIRDQLAEALAHEGYEVSTACDGLQALRKVFIHRPDVVVLDLVMPVVDGWQFLDLRVAYPMLQNLPIIVTSEVDSYLVDSRLHVAAVVPKPFLLDELIKTLHHVVGPPVRQERDIRIPVVCEVPRVGGPGRER
jgi:CheY-like chemotaxis protein